MYSLQTFQHTNSINILILPFYLPLFIPMCAHLQRLIIMVNISESIQKGEEVYIILNQAAGYKQAKVVIENNLVCGLDFTIQQNCNTDSDKDEISVDAEPNTGVVAENYELLAYEWVQDNIMLLNERLNESVGQGKTELFLASEELPIKESWQNIVVELEKEGIKDVECIPEGIKIKLLKD